jgi:hypothetical protein
MLMVRSAMSGHYKKEPIGDIIYKWWNTAFPARPFPAEGGTLNKLVLAIRYQLMRAGYERAGVTPSARFSKNCEAAVNFRDGDFEERSQALARCEALGEWEQIVIHPTSTSQEGDMASTKKTTSKKAISKKTAEGVTMRGLIDKHVAEANLTDDEITHKIRDAGFPKMMRSYCRDERKAINAGLRNSQGYPKPKKALEALVMVDGKRVPESKAPKTEPKAKGSKAKAKDKALLDKYGVGGKGKKATGKARPKAQPKAQPKASKKAK